MRSPRFRRRVKTNYHTHTTWCDGADTPRAMALSAIDKGFTELGFSSHAMFPRNEVPWELTTETIEPYFSDIRALAAELTPSLRILCGVEAEFVPGAASPDRAVYARFSPDYIIGSVHFVTAPDGFRVPVDDTVEAFFEGLRNHFGNSPEKFVREYFRLERQMVETCDFDVVAHPDLVRKFNSKFTWFDENAAWYAEELEHTANAIAASGKLTEINTGAICRGWLDEAYPSPRFRTALRRRGVRFILSSDAHSASAIDFAFDRYAGAESFTALQKA